MGAYDWANHVLGPPVTWPDFYVTNAVVVVLGIVAAQVGWRLPAIALAFPALMLINAVFFHVAPFFVERWDPSGFHSRKCLGLSTDQAAGWKKRHFFATVPPQSHGSRALSRYRSRGIANATNDRPK